MVERILWLQEWKIRRFLRRFHASAKARVERQRHETPETMLAAYQFILKRLGDELPPDILADTEAQIERLQQVIALQNALECGASHARE